MRNVSNAFKTALSNDNRNYQCTVTITLANNTVLTVTNAELWQGGLSMEDAVSQDSAFEALGSVAINSLNVILNNINDAYSDYDFTNAKVVASVSLTGVADVVKLGEFIVDSTNYNGSLITLYCLDNMSKFDKPYSESSLTYPATLQSIVTNACTDCGVTLNTTTFPNYTYQIATRPTDEALTYREIVSYAATVAGCFARINSNGALELKWFDTTTLSSLQTTINNNNGTLDPQNVSASVNAHRITALSSQDMSIEDVVITGIQIITKSDDTEIGMETHLYGLTGYVIKIENNPFITSTNVGTIGNYLSSLIVGLRFRKATVEHLSDPSIEAGDVALVWDRKNNVYTTLVTGTSFGVGKRQRTTSAAESPLKNSATRFTSATKTYVESLQFAQKEATLREQMEEDLTDAINAKSGMYETRVQEGSSGYIYYLHDKPLLADSAAVLKITSEAVAVTPNYQAQTPTWYGLTVDGNFIANIMSVIGIDFDWGTGGTLVLGGQNNVNGSLTIKNASNDPIGSWTNQGINATAGTIGGFSISSTSLSTTGFSIRSYASDSAYVWMGDTDAYLNITPYHIGYYSEQISSTNALVDVGCMNGRRGTVRVAEISSTNGDELNYILLSSCTIQAVNLETSSSSIPTVRVRNSVGTLMMAMWPDGDYGLIGTVGSSAEWLLRYDNVNTRAEIPHTTRIINGSLGVNKTGGTDGNAGFWANSAGNIYLTGGTNTGSVIYFYYNKATSATSNITETASGRLTASNTFNAATIGSGKKTAYNDGNAGVWLQSVGNIDISNASGGAIQWHYANSTNATSTITETASGVLTAGGSFIASGLGVNKTSGQDGNAGFWANSAGNVYLTGGTSAGSTIYFYFNKATSSTAYIGESASGVLTTNAYFTAKDYSGLTRQVVTSFSTDGQRLAGVGTANTVMQVSGQWGTTGSTYSSRNITAPSSDIRLKKNVKDTEVEALPIVNQMRVREFDWTDDRENPHQVIGVVADELEEIDPKLAVGGGYNEDGNMNIKSVDTFYLVGYLLKAIQELYIEIKELKGE